MKKFLTLSVLPSFLYINYAAAEDVSSFSSPTTGAHSTFSSTPRSVAELEIFLKNNYIGSSFPEEIFKQFSAPFSPEFSRLRRIVQLRIKRRSLEALDAMVALAYCAFTRVIEDNKRPLSVDAIKGMAASRLATLDVYRRDIHSYFLKFQQMLIEILNHVKDSDSEAKAMLTRQFGVSSVYKIAWIRDRNGIVPAPLQGRLKEILYHAPMPYGDWGDDLQRTMVFSDGAHIVAPGIFVSTTREKETFKFVLENGQRSDFRTSPITARIAYPSPLTTAVEPTLRLAGDNGLLGTFISMPATPEESREFEAALLENLLYERDEFSSTFLESYAISLNMASSEEEPLASSLTTSCIEEAGAEPATRERELTPSSDSLIEKHINSMLEDQVRKEQEAIIRLVAEGAIKGRVKAKKTQKRKTAAASPKAEAPSLPLEPPEGIRAKILSKIKERGREKWRTLIRVLRTALTAAYKGRILSINASVRGSHLTIHLHSPSGSDGITVIRPHRNDRTISAGEARGLAEKLVDITFELMGR